VEAKCVFCNADSFKGRVVAEDKNFWVVPTKGQITDGGYLLIIPKKHYRCIGEMESDVAGELTTLNDYLRGVLVGEYNSLVSGFEHGIGGQSIPHAHWHLFPAPVDFTARIANDFQSCETNTLISLRDVPRSFNLTKESYLLWQTPDGLLRACYMNAGPQSVPMQYLRTVAAQLLNRPERGNWRTMDPALDDRLCEETVQRMAKYFKPR